PNSNPPPTGAPPPPPPGTYDIDNTTVINTSNAGPTIVTQGVSSIGVSYKDLVTNGSPSGFLFGATSLFDNQFDFDNFFTHQFETTAVFAFDSVQLGGGISFLTNGGANSVALIGNNGITDLAGSVNLAGINDILFATKAG